MLSKISETKTSTSWYHIHVKSEWKKVELKETGLRKSVNRDEDNMRSKREWLIKGTNSQL